MKTEGNSLTQLIHSMVVLTAEIQLCSATEVLDG